MLTTKYMASLDYLTLKTYC